MHTPGWGVRPLTDLELDRAGSRDPRRSVPPLAAARRLLSVSSRYCLRPPRFPKLRRARSSRILSIVDPKEGIMATIQDRMIRAAKLDAELLLLQELAVAREVRRGLRKGP